MLKPLCHAHRHALRRAATFGWLCVETRQSTALLLFLVRQPPSGGCVLKPVRSISLQRTPPAATFGWLCVETRLACLTIWQPKQPPSGGCVLKRYQVVGRTEKTKQPPSGGCVLKHYKIDCDKLDELAATFGWLCVETSK